MSVFCYWFKHLFVHMHLFCLFLFLHIAKLLLPSLCYLSCFRVKSNSFHFSFVFNPLSFLSSSVIFCLLPFDSFYFLIRECHLLISCYFFKFVLFFYMYHMKYFYFSFLAITSRNNLSKIVNCKFLIEILYICSPLYGVTKYWSFTALMVLLILCTNVWSFICFNKAELNYR